MPRWAEESSGGQGSPSNGASHDAERGSAAHHWTQATLAGVVASGHRSLERLGQLGEVVLVREGKLDPARADVRVPAEQALDRER